MTDVTVFILTVSSADFPNRAALNYYPDCRVSIIGYFSSLSFLLYTTYVLGSTLIVSVFVCSLQHILSLPLSDSLTN